MLSYRHAFHAGGPADVLKHAVLAFVIAHERRKPRPLYILDTHAGAGAYDLGSDAALKTGEARTGILRLRNTEPPPPLLSPYLGLLDGTQPYPGSPLLAHALLRPQDRLELVELHPTDHALLARDFGQLPRTRVTRADGLALLVERMPPHEQRSITLIDPSYEVKTEYHSVIAALTEAHRRFERGIYILWYPVLERARTETFLAELRGSGMRGQYRIELGTRPDASGQGMTASGMVVVNPPWTLPQAVAEALPWLAEQLQCTGPRVAEWLVPA